ncbi:MAG: hypothetical protein QOG64_558, partial [Acidimicrobiaceae bacterium]|nr:hypothetical protein [Acidimicrobiaceae bacterium]
STLAAKSTADRRRNIRTSSDGLVRERPAPPFPTAYGASMAEDDVLALIDTFGKAWADHDLDAALALVSDDCVFDGTGPAPDGTKSVGRDEIRAAWQPIFDDANSGFDAEETFVAGDRVVQRWRYSWNGGHVRGVDLFKVRDGLVVEKFSYVKG